MGLVRGWPCRLWGQLHPGHRCKQGSPGPTGKDDCPANGPDVVCFAFCFVVVIVVFEKLSRHYKTKHFK